MAVLPLQSVPPANPVEFEKATVTEGSASIPYRLFRPRVLDKDRKYPPGLGAAEGVEVTGV